MNARKGTRFTNKEGVSRTLKPQWVARPGTKNTDFPNLRKPAPQSPASRRRRCWKTRPKRRMLYVPLEPSMAELKEEIEKGVEGEPTNGKDHVGFRFSVRFGGQDKIPPVAKETFLDSARKILIKRKFQLLAPLFAQDKAVGRACRKIVERMVMKKLDEEVKFVDSKNEASPQSAMILMEAIGRIRKTLGPDADFCWELDEDHEIDMLEELCEDPLGSHYVQAEVDERRTKSKIELIIARMTGKIRSLDNFRLPEMGETLEKSLGSAGRLRVKGKLIKGNIERKKEILFEGTSFDVGQRIFGMLHSRGIFSEYVMMPSEDEDTVFNLPKGRKFVISQPSKYNDHYEVSVHAPMVCYHLDFRLK